MDIQKLIFSDLDGTLLPTPGQPLTTDVFTLIHKLHRKGIYFCISSGRSYPILRSLFEPVVDKIYFLAENGALGYHTDRLLFRTVMPKELCRELIASIRLSTSCEVRVNTSEGSYIITDSSLENLFSRGLTDKSVHRIKHFAEIKGDITKISAFCPNGIHAASRILLPLWEDKIEAAISCDKWIDFSLAGKGNGLRKLCEYLKVPLEHTIAFGDNYNDVTMLQTAGQAYIMASACEELKKWFPHHCESVPEILRSLERIY